MPRMIPPIVDSSTPSSERRVFDALAAISDGKRWIVLHSLAVSSSWTGRYGEIDFLALVPSVGMVCVEVKGGGIRSSEGEWFTRNAQGIESKLKRSPFIQAKDGMWKLQKILEKKFGAGSEEARCPLGWVVVFPDVTCPPPTPEFVRADVIDRTDLLEDLGHTIRSLPSLSALANRNDLVLPSERTIQSLLRFLRPDFERIALPNVIDPERRMAELTEEQYRLLDGLEDNRLVIVKGAAGTGKTIIALEATRRAAASGDNVVLCCFNRNLGGWLGRQTASLGPGKVVSGHLHGILRERILQSSLGTELLKAEGTNPPPKDFFTKAYYELGALAIHEAGERFERVIVDEAQDFPPEGLAHVVGAWTDGNATGSTFLFGDFLRQAIYQASGSLDSLKSEFGNAALYGLSLNCRNTKRIGVQTELMTGFTGCRTSERQVEGEPVAIEYVTDNSRISAKVADIFVRLKALGYCPDDVVILGGRRRNGSSLAKIDRLNGWGIRDIEEAAAGDVTYATIHSFKGLEKRVVILIEAISPLSEETDALLYVGMSRAVLRLFVVCREEWRERIETRVRNGVSKLVGTA